MIVFDMDSTLIDAETIDELARAAGVVSKVEEITKRAMCGDLDFGQALAERVNLLEGLPLETVLDAVNQINLMPGAAELKKDVFEELVRLNRVRPERCVVVGDGANDACVFEKAGFAIAFNPKPILREYADVVITKKDLKSIIPVLESLSYQFCNQAQHVDIEQQNY
jgi:phosphoserine phosphatase